MKKQLWLEKWDAKKMTPFHVTRPSWTLSKWQGGLTWTFQPWCPGFWGCQPFPFVKLPKKSSYRFYQDVLQVHQLKHIFNFRGLGDTHESKWSHMCLFFLPTGSLILRVSMSCVTFLSPQMKTSP